MEISNRILRTELIEWRKAEWFQDKLKEISKSDFAKLKNSLVSNSFIQPFNVWQNGTIKILDGHHRKLAMEQLEAEGTKIPDFLPANFVDCKDAKEARKLVLVYSSIYAKATEETLYEFIETNDLKFDELKLEIDLPEIKLSHFEKNFYTSDIEEDEAPEPPAEARTKTGDLYELGAHRLLCGDSTNGDDVTRLMDGKKAGLMATDPPYGVAYNNVERPNPGIAKPRIAKPRIANDELISGPQMQEFLESMLVAALPSMELTAAFYFWHPMLTQGTYVAAAAAAGILIHRQIIWVKPGLLLGRGDYHWRHELCFYGWQQGNRPPFYGPRNQDTVWEIGNVTSKERKEMNHATPKPVALWEKPLNNHTRIGEICYEPFAGSGTQFIAAEQLKRICYGMEIEPKYCDVIVSRWCNFTKQNTVKLNGEEIVWQ